MRLDVPFLSSNRAGSDNDYETHFGDIQITPRILISESRDFTQTLDVAFRIPSGSADNGNGFGVRDAKVGVLVERVVDARPARGRSASRLPYTDSDRTRNLFITNFAAGYYFTPHDYTPFGDLVFYLSMNLNRPIDDRGPKDTFVSLTPGFRTHLGANWYLLGGIEVPVTNLKPFDFQILGE